MKMNEQGGTGIRMGWETGVSRWKLSYAEQINSRVLLYSTGNYIQYLVINYNELLHNCTHLTS